MSNSETKNAIARIWKPPTLTRFEPVELTHVSHAVVRRWNDYSPHPPTAHDLDKVWSRVHSAWQSEGSLESVPSAMTRWVPWTLFYPPTEPRAWLGGEPNFVEHFAHWLETQRAFGPRLVATTIRVLLSQYPQKLDTFPRWLEIARTGLERESSRRLEAWRGRHANVGLLDQDGPARVARMLIASDGGFEKVRASLGLDDMAASLGFLRACVRAALFAGRNVIARARTVEDLTPFVSLVETAPKQLRFPELAPTIADAFLLPWVQKSPGPEVREAIRIFLVGHLGDPRTLHSPKWHGVSDDAVAVMRRWVVGANLEDFFAVIGITAYDRQWGYREAFWMAYAEREYIDNAWVVFGRDAAREAKSHFDRKMHHYGVLDGAQGDQSVIIMQIGDLIIVEGSHNWMCRIWKLQSKAAPQIGKNLYRKIGLTRNPDFLQRHAGSESGAWQSNLSEYIAQQTGRRCSYDDWYPKKRSKSESAKTGRPLATPTRTPPPTPPQALPKSSSSEPGVLTKRFSESATSPQALLRRMLAQPGTFEGRIAKCVGDNPGIKARDIAKDLQIDKTMVNHILYSNLMVFEKDAEHQWSLRL